MYLLVPVSEPHCAGVRALVILASVNDSVAMRSLSSVLAVRVLACANLKGVVDWLVPTPKPEPRPLQLV